MDVFSVMAQHNNKCDVMNMLDHKSNPVGEGNDAETQCQSRRTTASWLEAVARQPSEIPGS